MPSKCPQNYHKGNGKCCFYCVCLQVMGLLCIREAASLGIFRRHLKTFWCCFWKCCFNLTLIPRTFYVFLFLFICNYCYCLAYFYFVRHHWVAAFYETYFINTTFSLHFMSFYFHHSCVCPLLQLSISVQFCDTFFLELSVDNLWVYVVLLFSVSSPTGATSPPI